MSRQGCLVRFIAVLVMVIDALISFKVFESISLSYQLNIIFIFTILPIISSYNHGNIHLSSLLQCVDTHSLTDGTFQALRSVLLPYCPNARGRSL